MAKKPSKETYKAQWLDGLFYELKTYCRKKSVKGKEFVELTNTELVAIDATEKRAKATKAAHEKMRGILAALKAARPKTIKKGRK